MNLWVLTTGVVIAAVLTSMVFIANSAPTHRQHLQSPLAGTKLVVTTPPQSAQAL